MKKLWEYLKNCVFAIILIFLFSLYAFCVWRLAFFLTEIFHEDDPGGWTGVIALLVCTAVFYLLGRPLLNILNKIFL